MIDTVALIAGYVIVVAIVVRWPLVVTQRRRGLAVLHTLAMAAVVGAWLKKGYPAPALVNAAWLVVAAIWYIAGGRRPAKPAPVRARDRPAPLDNDDQPDTT